MSADAESQTARLLNTVLLILIIVYIYTFVRHFVEAKLISPSTQSYAASTTFTFTLSETYPVRIAGLLQDCPSSIPFFVAPSYMILKSFIGDTDQS